MKSLVPQCIGVIVDGNRRWAKKHGLPSFRGHEEGYRKLKEFLGWAKEAGVKYVIAYVFSQENWKRSFREVSFLMRLLRRLFKDDLGELKKQHVRLRIAGARERMPKTIRVLAEKAEEATAAAEGVTLILAFSYGGRDEIIAAVNALLADRSGRVQSKITKDEFARHLWTAGVPDPEVIIRTSGEKRLSNFLPWQSVYSELFFLNTLWPDITKKEFLAVLREYHKRKRRFGT